LAHCGANSWHNGSVSEKEGGQEYKKSLDYKKKVDKNKNKGVHGDTSNVHAHVTTCSPFNNNLYKPWVEEFKTCARSGWYIYIFSPSTKIIRFSLNNVFFLFLFNVQKIPSNFDTFPFSMSYYLISINVVKVSGFPLFFSHWTRS
jgi:hypothetical protein